MVERQQGDSRYWSVPRCWAGETAVVVGCGPSLTAAQLACCRGKARVIVVNNAYEMAPWADWLWATDWRWWRRYIVSRDNELPPALTFAGERITCSEEAATFPGMRLLRMTGDDGYDPDPSAIRSGRNGGSVGIQLAMKAGVARIILLGIDMAGGHFHNHYPPKWNCSSWKGIASRFDQLVPALKDLGIEVINCSPGSALQTFPQAALGDVL
jgi:hypothetical protein